MEKFSYCPINISSFLAQNLEEIIENDFNIDHVLQEIISIRKIIPPKTQAIILGCTHFNFVKKQFEKLCEGKDIITSDDVVISPLGSFYSNKMVKNTSNIIVFSKANKYRDLNNFIVNNNYTLYSSFKDI